METARLVLRVLWIAVHGLGVGLGCAEEVYRNLGTKDSEPGYYPSIVEYGDEIRLGGLGREIVRFHTEYFGDLPAANQATGRIRFYANDGPGRYPSPGTLLFESDPFPIFAGFNGITVEGIEVTVPDNFTWTMQFAGVSGGVGDQAGLLLYDPPSTGFSFDDFWTRSGTNWTLFRLAPAKANFAAELIARDELNVEFEHAHLFPQGQFEFHLVGLVGRTCIVQASTNLTTWNAIGLFDLTQSHTVFVDTNAPAFSRRFYRALTTLGGPMKFGDSSRTTNGLTQVQISGPERLTFLVQASSDLVNWTEIMTNTFESRPTVFIDPGSGASGRRFYRARLMP